jgi:subtilisin
MAKQNKRYLVTYTDGSINADAAVKVLGVPKANCKDGVMFMASDSVASSTDVLHFENLGVSSIELTDIEASTLSTKAGVMAVEEDVEMFAFNDVDDEVQFQELFMQSFEQEAGEDEFFQGYKKAMMDMFDGLLNLTHQNNADSLQLPVFPPRPIIRQPIRPIIAQPIPWNIKLVKAPEAWKRGTTGSGVNVAILDTGIASHGDLVISGGASFIPGSTSFNDLHGHGTHCAGIVGAKFNLVGVVGVAPDARLFAVKVLNDNGSGQSSWIIAGMEWCVRNKIHVASMSLGSTNAPMIAYANAIKRCQENGVTVVTASGNSYGSIFPWVCAPANSFAQDQPSSSPMAVGAVDRSQAIASFSSRGGQHDNWNKIQCVAPGVAINSTYLRNGYRSLNGTSMACPHVAGLAALVIQRYPGITPANVIRRISSTCTDLGPAGLDQTFGFGLIDCDRATR